MARFKSKPTANGIHNYRVLEYHIDHLTDSIAALVILHNATQGPFQPDCNRGSLTTITNHNPPQIILT